MEKAREEIIEKPLLNNITRNEKKEPYLHINRYIQVRGDEFNRMMRLLESLVLTPKEEAKIKDLKRKEKTENRLNALREKYDVQGCPSSTI